MTRPHHGKAPAAATTAASSSSLSIPTALDIEMGNLKHSSSREPLLSSSSAASSVFSDDDDGDEDLNGRRPGGGSEATPFIDHGDASDGAWSGKGRRRNVDDDDGESGSQDGREHGDRRASGHHDGVDRADAMTLGWSRPALMVAYSFIFLCSFANALQWQVMSNLMPYVVSEFSAHSLIPTIGIMASVLSGILKLPIARMIDAWGRPQGLTSMVVLATVGLVLMALSPNVKAFAAANIFYEIGISGFTYVLDIVVADTSSLKNRAIAFAFNSSPNLITTFIGPAVATWFYRNSNWRWAFFISAIVFVILSVPLLSILIASTRKAKERGLAPRGPPEESRSRSRSIKQFMRDHDAAGILLINAGLTLVLVPFSLVGLNSSGGETQQEEGGESASGSPLSSNAILIVLGLVLIALFALNERRCANPLIRFELLFSPNVAGALLLFVAVFVAFFAWDNYYSSYLQVVHDLSIVEAGYISHIYGLGFPLWAAATGYLIRRTDRFRWVVWCAVPLHVGGGALMLLFRRPDTPVVWVVLCQVLITAGGTTLVVGGQMAVMAVASHAELASVMALLSLASYVGSALGSALSGAIWNSTLPAALAELLPPGDTPGLIPGGGGGDGSNSNGRDAAIARLAADLTEQLRFPMGHPVREAVVLAYDRAQVRMCVAGTAASLVSIVAVAMFRDARVSKSRQVKGTVL